MSIHFFYRTATGRALMKLLQSSGAFHLTAWFLKTKLSRLLILYYIKKHDIDMTEFAGQTYQTFADFFARTRPFSSYIINPNVLISPCDGLLSVYPISSKLILPMKGSRYRLKDILPVHHIASYYRNGLCLVFRLQASDYHHFCCIDDAKLLETHFIEGQLHSVQPIACDTVPVYRLNRRWWSVLDTAHFDRVAQIEVGAMMVGGVRFEKQAEGDFERGDELGCFELAGSTVILLVNASVKNKLLLFDKVQMAWNGVKEIPIHMGEGIGVLQDEG